MKDNRGWVVWSLSRMGVMIAVLAILLMTYTIYKYITCVAASDSANRKAEGLAETLALIYAGPIGIETSYVMPEKIEGHEYNASVINDTKRGIFINLPGTRCGTCSGGAPFNLKIGSYPSPLKNTTDGNVTLAIRNLDNGVNIRRVDECCNCIAIEAFNYNTGDDCNNLNGEYVSLKNICDHPCDVTGWTVEDKIEARKPYRFPARTIVPQATVTLHTGCGTDSSFEAYWCSSGYPCNAVWNNDGDTLTLRESGGFKCLEDTYP